MVGILNIMTFYDKTSKTLWFYVNTHNYMPIYAYGHFYDFFLIILSRRTPVVNIFDSYTVYGFRKVWIYLSVPE